MTITEALTILVGSMLASPSSTEERRKREEAERVVMKESARVMEKRDE